MPSPTAPTIRKSNREKKSRVISDFGSVPKHTTKNPKHQVSLLTEVRLAKGLNADLSSSSDESVVQVQPTVKMTKKSTSRNEYDGYTREYLYTKWLQSKDLLDSEVRKNSNLLHDLKVRDSIVKSFERKSIIQEELEKN